MIIYTIVFGFILKAIPQPGNPSHVDVFALWLSSALLPWILFSGVINSTMGSLLANENLVKKVNFARSTLVVAAALAVLFTSFFEMGVLVVVLYLFGANPTFYLPLVVLFMVLLAALGLGMGFFLAVGNVYFRDTQHFMSIVLQMLFYLTPILYPITRLDAQLNRPGRHWIYVVYRLNPLERFTEVFRNLLYDNRLPGLWSSVYCAVVSLVVLVAGFALFTRYEGRLAEEL
jgi:ABC-2 type transport system permease protein